MHCQCYILNAKMFTTAIHALNIACWSQTASSLLLESLPCIGRFIYAMNWTANSIPVSMHVKRHEIVYRNVRPAKLVCQDYFKGEFLMLTDLNDNKHKKSHPHILQIYSPLFFLQRIPVVNFLSSYMSEIINSPSNVRKHAIHYNGQLILLI